MASARVVCLYVLFLHFCWAPCSSITRAPRRVSSVLKLSSDEGLVQQRTNGFGGRDRVDGLRVVKRDSSTLPKYDIVRAQLIHTQLFLVYVCQISATAFVSQIRYCL